MVVYAPVNTLPYHATFTVYVDYEVPSRVLLFQYFTGFVITRVLRGLSQTVCFTLRLYQNKPAKQEFLPFFSIFCLMIQSVTYAFVNFVQFDLFAQ